MSRLRNGIVASTGAFVCAAFLYTHYRILPLDGDRPKHRVAVLSAATDTCARSVQDDREVVLQTYPDLHRLKVNEERLALGQLRDVLTDLLYTRVDRTIFLVDNSGVDHRASSVLEKFVEQVPVVDRVCVIDPQHAPSWYPPVPRRFPGGSGGIQTAL